MRKDSWTNIYKGITMESLWLELIKNLEKQEQYLKQLLITAREHNRALRQLDAGKLTDIVGREESLTGMILREEKERKKITDGLAEELDIDKELVLSQFAGRAPQEIGEGLTALLDNMKRIAQELSDMNDLNGALTRQAMRFNQVMLKIFSPAGKNIYTQSGKRAEDSLNLSLLDKKV